MKFELSGISHKLNGSRPARGAWIEIFAAATGMQPTLSRPARGAWIEISGTDKGYYNATVAPREGRVD